LRVHSENTADIEVNKSSRNTNVFYTTTKSSTFKFKEFTPVLGSDRQF